ncbi:hypothetical protein [Streptomyces sp. V4I2]|uniref:hypothetical protein n=1 Tax=Streptomyces sp. V4I2 TaxID=3042280 RepID=UPI00278AD781|nr:hypothetical protein [Streptomyces sp. V4I2]MDQ1041945.1 hypothetical protein [Streptomyces sp. V4I2]
MVTAVRAANPGQSLSRRNAHTTAMSPAAIHVEDHNAIGRKGQQQAYAAGVWQPFGELPGPVQADEGAEQQQRRATAPDTADQPSAHGLRRAQSCEDRSSLAGAPAADRPPEGGGPRRTHLAGILQLQDVGDPLAGLVDQLRGQAVLRRMGEDDLGDRGLVLLAGQV